MGKIWIYDRKGRLEKVSGCGSLVCVGFWRLFGLISVEGERWVY